MSRQKVFDKDRWWDLLSRFIDVLRVNMFIVDTQGSIVLPPEENKYGGALLMDPDLGLGLFQGSQHVIEHFDMADHYLEAVLPYELRVYALKIAMDGRTMGYLIIGPLMLNSRLDKNYYIEEAKNLGADSEKLISEIHQIRAVSNLMIRSILDLLTEIIRDNVEIMSHKKELNFLRNTKSDHSRIDIMEEVYETVRTDELLASLLDVAMKMAETECGSIMILDEDKGDLVMKVSRGLGSHRLQSHRKVGDGISGVSFLEKTPFIIDNLNRPENNRIQKHIERPDIKQAVVVPLIGKDHVIGVLNLHTKKDICSSLEEKIPNLLYLSNLLSAVI